MKIQLTPQESEQHFLDAMCNGLGELQYYDLEFNWDDEAYQETRTKLKSPCFEDVIMEMIRDGKDVWIEDVNEDESYYITLKMIHERVQETPIRHLMDAINERGDATTADCILQTVVYGEVIYG